MRVSSARCRVVPGSPSQTSPSLRRGYRPLRAGSAVATGDNSDPSAGRNIDAVSQGMTNLKDHGTAVSEDQLTGSDPTKEYSTRSEILPLLKFALPTLCIAVTSPLLSLVDASVVGLASEAQLAAMAPATALSDGVGYILTFIPTAVTNLVALHMARKHPRAAGAVVSEALALSAVICVAIAGVLLAATPAFFTAVASLSPEMITTAAAYVRWRALGLPFAVGYSVMQAFFLACQAPRIPMLATAAAGVVNLFGDLLLCQVFSFGAAGAAAATSAANVVVFFLMLYFIRRPLPPQSTYGGQAVPVQATVPHPATAATFLSIAGPVLGVIVLKVLFFGTIAARAAEAGSVIAAGHQIIFSIAMFFGVFGDTVCHAAQAFLPPKIGTPQAAWAFSKAIFACGAIIGVVNVFASTAFAFFAVPLFTSSAAVQAAVRGALPLFACHILLHCCSMGTEGILLAARDAWFLLASYTFAFSVLRGVIDWSFAQGWGLSACWFTTATFMALRLAMNGARLLRPGSVLSRTVPLSDNRQQLKEQARQLAAAAGSPVSDIEDESDSDAGDDVSRSDTAADGVPAGAAATADTPTPTESNGSEAGEFRGAPCLSDGRPGGRGRGVWLVDIGSKHDVQLPADLGAGVVWDGLGRPGGRGRGGAPGPGGAVGGAGTAAPGA
eukprot:jgi/Ulvmu1/1737/UM117_0014.1